MACECISCPECRGSGNVWHSYSGEYLGSGRCDDLDKMESCYECDGTGIIELCAECQESMDEEYER